MNALIPFAFFMGKMTIIVFAIKLIGLMNLKVGILLLIVNIGVLLAKLLALKKGYGHHHLDLPNAHYYFNFPTGSSAPAPSYYPKYTIKHSSYYPKADAYGNNLWDDIHRNDQPESTQDPTYGPQIANPYYTSQLEQLRYSQQFPPYPHAYKQYNKRQLLSLDDNSHNEPNSVKQKLTEQTTTAHELSTILDDAMTKLSKD